MLPVLLTGVLASRQAPQSDDASPLLHPLFQDHAVLQRARPINVYGETVPGAAVAVTLGSAAAATRAEANGHWSARLPALGPGGPYTLTASANGETRSASDILVGDVFFCSGQSNMAFSQRQAQGAAADAVRRQNRAFATSTCRPPRL
jgi:sialate O-acetylesterase